MELELVVDNTKTALMAYKKPFEPTRFYYDPVKEEDTLKRHIREFIRERIQHGPSPIRMEVCPLRP
eukprot:1182076-Prorocentrum_minimum.AAC.1